MSDSRAGLSGWRWRLANWIARGRLLSLETEVVIQNLVIDDAEDALIEIIEMETPKCAHIGKRMSARAREFFE